MSEPTVTIDREIAHVLHWAMHELDERRFTCASEDHRRIVFTSAKELRDILASALAEPAAPAASEGEGEQG